MRTPINTDLEKPADALCRALKVKGGNADLQGLARRVVGAYPGAYIGDSSSKDLDLVHQASRYLMKALFPSDKLIQGDTSGNGESHLTENRTITASAFQTQLIPTTPVTYGQNLCNLLKRVTASMLKSVHTGPEPPALKAISSKA